MIDRRSFASLVLRRAVALPLYVLGSLAFRAAQAIENLAGQTKTKPKPGEA